MRRLGRGCLPSAVRGVRRGRLPAKLLFPHLLLAFFDNVESVSFNIVEDLPLATRPIDLNSLSAGGFSQPKMSPQITLRKITATAGDLADLRQSTSHHAYTSPHGVAVTLCSHQFEVEKVVAVAPAVAQQQGRVVVIAHHHIHEAVVVEVGKRDPSADVRGLKSIACTLCGF